MDDSYLELTGEAGVGVVVRDRCGTVIFTAWKYFKKYGSAAEAKIIACMEGLRWANHWGLSQVIIELDCARVISSLEKPTGRQIRDHPNCRGVEKFDLVDERVEVFPS